MLLSETQLKSGSASGRSWPCSNSSGAPPFIGNFQSSGLSIPVLRSPKYFPSLVNCIEVPEGIALRNSGIELGGSGRSGAPGGEDNMMT